MIKLPVPVMFLCSLLLPVCLLTAAHAGPAFDPATMLDVKDVHRGAAATSRTVFSGVDITEFHLQIVDVMQKVNMGSDMILARVVDGPLITRQSGIVGGMSGSPVYINGKLIGAIAWAWNFQKEPVAGITPIRSMLEAFDIMDTPETVATLSAAAPRWTASQPLRLGGKDYRAAQVMAPGTQAEPGVLPLRAVATPVSCSGMGAETLSFLKDKLARFGVEPMAGGGQKADSVPVDLVPGAAVGVRFMEGDFDMTGIGTITYRSGDRVLGFGHPMMQLGRVNLPLTTAWINDFMPNYERANKMGAGMDNVGILMADMPWAIGGQIGPKAPLIPARIDIVDQSRGITKTYNIRVLRHPGLTSLIMASGIASALEAAFNPAYEGTLREHFEVHGDRGASVSRDNQYSFQGSPVRAGLSDVSDVMTILEENRWQPQQIKDLYYRAEINSKNETLVIERIYAEENVAKAGKPLNVHVLVRPENGELTDHKLTVTLPLDMPKGVLRIGVSSGKDTMYMRSRFGVSLPEFDNLPPLLDYYSKLEQNKQLCMVIGLPGSAMSVGSTRLSSLPESISTVLEKSPRTDVSRGKDEITVTKELSGVVSGLQALALVAEDRQGAKGTPPSTTKPFSEPAKTPSPEGVTVGGPNLSILAWAVSALKPMTRAALRAAAPPDEEIWPAATEQTPTVKIEPAGQPVKKTDETSTKPTADTGKKETPATSDTSTAVVRQPMVWTQAKNSDFIAGEAKGVTVRGEGGLTGMPPVTSLAKLEEFYVWGTLATDKGNYIATASPGRVYRLSADGVPQMVLDSGSFGVRALAADSAGNIYAGTWAGGTIYKLTPDDKSSVFCQLPADYVWALAFDKQGQLLAGTGPQGTLYQIDTAGTATPLVQVPQENILSLLVTDQAIWLGTAGKGLVYRLLPGQQLLAALDTNGDDVTSLAAGPSGEVYAATAPGGKVYRLDGDQWVTVLFDDKTTPVYGLLATNDGVYATTGTDGKLLQLVREGVYDTIYKGDMTHLLCLTRCPQGDLLIGTANGGNVLLMTPTAVGDSTYTSAVLDAQRSSRWGVIDWQAALPAGATVAVQTRSGNSANPDDGSWSAWSQPYTQPGVDRISSPVGRYLQYRVTFHKAAGKDVPTVRGLTLNYLPANQNPKVDFDDGLADKPLHATVELKWTATDADKDQLLATVEYRAAGADKWTLLKRLAADKKSCEWDTSKLKDGAYDVQITVSDEASNPGAGLAASKILSGLCVDNTKPEVLLQKVEAKDGNLIVEGIASDQNRVSEVTYQLDDIWRGALPLDGVFDAQYEQFTIAVPLVDGKAKIQLRVRDRAGNVATQEIVWPIPAEKPGA